MNLKKVKLIHETPVHYILHDGQTHFHVAKEGLDDAMRSKIHEFAVGGEAKLGTGKRFDKLKEEISKDPNIKDSGAVAASIGRKKYGDQKFNVLAQHNKMAEGGQVKPQPTPSQSDKIGKAIVDKLDPDKIVVFHPFSEGGEIDHNVNPMEARNAKILNTVMEDATLREMFKQHFAGENDIPVESIVQPDSQVQDYLQGLQVNQSSPEASIMTGKAELPALEQAASSQPVPESVSTAVTPVMTGEAKFPASSTTPPTQQAAPVLRDSTESQLNRLAKGYEDLAKKRVESDSKFLTNYASNPINAQRYMDNMGTGQKIATAVGIILGGLGEHGNAALDMLNKTINNDIEAQKSNQSANQNMWKMNHESLGDQMAANLATRNNMLDIAKYQMDKLMGNAPGPMALQKADALKTQIDAEKAQNNNTIAMIGMKQKILSDQNSVKPGRSPQDPSTLVPFLVPNPETQKAVFKEIQDRQNIVRDKPAIMSAFNQAVQDKSLLGGGKFNPASVNKLHQLLLPFFQELDGTVRQAAMDETFRNITPILGDSATKNKQRTEALEGWMNSKLSAPTSRGYGIDLDKYQSTYSPDLAPITNKKVDIFMRQNPSVKSPDEAIQILKAHGKL